MGKKLKLREARRFAAEEAFRARLRTHARTEPRQGFIDCFAEFPASYRAKVEAYRAFALNPPEAWRCNLRIRAPEVRFLDLVRFVFARFPVARHLETAWLDGLGAGNRRESAGRAAIELAGLDLCRWYIIAAQGRSLYGEVAHPFLTRRETHHFVAAPDAVTSTARAFWYAVVRAATDDEAAALRLARSKIAAFPVIWDFWKDTARFLARNRISIPEINDLIDYLAAAREEDPEFSLEGRSLPALRRRMEEWHERLWAQCEIYGGKWHGRAQPDAYYEMNGQGGRAIWWFSQIKNGAELYREGERMHHCVASYAGACADDRCSIWSLTCEYPAGKLNRCLTIEVSDNGEIVQCRGFANRRPLADEIAMIRHWANEHGLTLASRAW